MVKCPHAAAGCNYPEGDCPGHCLVDNGLRQHRSEALRLADSYEATGLSGHIKAAAELRRLYAENEDFRATIDHLIRENAEQIGEIVALKEQRDELLAALRRIADTSANQSGTGAPWVHWVDQARAAIAKAGGAA